MSEARRHSLEGCERGSVHLETCGCGGRGDRSTGVCTCVGVRLHAVRCGGGGGVVVVVEVVVMVGAVL